MYYIYHIPNIKKIGCTNNLERRVEKQQGWNKSEYQVLFATSDVKKASDVEYDLQRVYGYKIDINRYETLINMKINTTPQTTTFTAHNDGNDEMHHGAIQSSPRSSQ